MKQIIIKTQQELDALPDGGFTEYTQIIIQNDPTQGRIYVRKSWGNSSVEARDNSSVVAWHNSSVEARHNSSVEAWDNSSVEAWDNSSVVAWGNSSVVAWDNSSVVARDNSSVVAWGNVGVHVHSDTSSVLLYMFAVCWVLFKGKTSKVKKKAKTAAIIKPTSASSTSDWLDSQGTKRDHGNVVVYKRVSAEYKTQESSPQETVWAVGQTLTHPSWKPSSDECGNGKYHACSRPYFCDQFRSKKGDKYIAIKVAVKDLYAWTKNAQYPHKIAFKKGTVLYECDKFGKKL